MDPVKIPFQGYLSSLPVIYWQNSEDTLCQRWTALSPFCRMSRSKWGKVTVINQLSHLPPASTSYMCKYSLFLLLLCSSFQVETGVTLFWEVTVREHCQGKSGFLPLPDPNWAKSEQSHQMFSTSLPSWEEDKTSAMKTNIFKGTAQLLANLYKMGISFRTEETVPMKRVRFSTADWERLSSHFFSQVQGFSYVNYHVFLW